MEPSLITLIAMTTLLTATVAFITVANWPLGETPYRELGDTPELSPTVRL